MDYLSIVNNLFEENELESLDLDLIEYFEEIVGYTKNGDDFFTNLIIKYLK